MKLTNQTYLPPITPSSQPTAPDNSAPLTSGNGQQTADRSKIVYGSNAGNGGGIEYPTTSNEKVGDSKSRSARAAKPSRRGGGGGSGSGGGSNPSSGSSGAGQGGAGGSNPGSGNSGVGQGGAGGSNPGSGNSGAGQGGSGGGSNPSRNNPGVGQGGSRTGSSSGSRSPIKPKGASPSMRNSIKNTQDINDLHDKNGFKPLSSELAASARSALINGGTNLLVGIPMSVTEHMASKAIISRIEGQATMPGAEKKGADGKITTVDPAATEQQKIDARLEDSEIKTELMANQILSINEGPEAKAVSKKADASKNTAERLTNQEKTLESIEKQIEDLSKRYDIVHKPYEAEKSSDTPTDKSRMDNIAKHYTHLNKTLMRLINAVDADVKAKAQADGEPSW
ncbi:hypothetical protein QF016_004315 [Pseudomonas marginalis]|nr:hypothetical protein [Pseudomonas marginalis]